ncbi:MAG: hypothetical protein EZS28_035349 [Streblomastix strix]|uniref:Uncharacterized protein n=1 Tax=Streblomastix strix TaxID=222440 RepID=A0A5J4UFU2_9EUKA|nr:MAG: hypothetical protein EZS28_035349 [Streblomastix strix]
MLHRCQRLIVTIYPSVRRNILCVDGAFIDLRPYYFVDDDGKPSSSILSYTDDKECIFRGGFEKLVSTSFVPVLKRSSHKLDDENNIWQFDLKERI